MNFADRVKETTTSTGPTSFTLSGVAPTGYRGVAAAFASGTAGIPMCIEDPVSGSWISGSFTLSGSTITLNTVYSSSNNGSAVTFPAGTKNVFCTVPASSVAGFLTQSSLDAISQPISTYLIANPASTPSNADNILLVQGSNVVGLSLSVLATYVNNLWPNSKDSTSVITSTAAFPIDATMNRKKILCTATPTAINAPTTYSTVGDGFQCDIINDSGNSIPLGSGIRILPAGSTSIPDGSVARISGLNGMLYANLATAVVQATLPGQVTGLTLGTATSSTLPATWSAPSTGTSPFTYTVQYRVTGSGTWLTATSGINGTSYTLTGLTASTSYDIQVAASNSAGTGTYSTTATKSAIAAPSAPGQVTGLTVGTTTSSSAPLTWTVPSTGGTPDSYTVEYRVTSVGGAWTQASTSVTGTSYTVTSLTASTGYDFRVTAVNGSGSGTPSATTTGTTTGSSSFAVTTAVPAAIGTSGQAMTFNITYTGTLSTPTVTVNGSAATVSNVTDLGSGNATFTIVAPAPWDYSGAGAGHIISVSGTSGSAQSSRFATQTSNIAFPYTIHPYFGTFGSTVTGLPKFADLACYMQASPTSPTGSTGTASQNSTTEATNIAGIWVGFSRSNVVPPPGPKLTSGTHPHSTNNEWLASMTRQSNTLYTADAGAMYADGVVVYYWMFVKDTSGNTQSWVSNFTVTL